MADQSSWWDGATWQPGTEQWWVWDGAAWVAAIEAYAWDGMIWRKIFPTTDVVESAAETANPYIWHVLAKIDRNQQYTASESAALYLRHVMEPQSRNITKDARDHIGVSESTAIAKQMTSAETAAAYVFHVLAKQQRNVNKDTRDHIGVSETAARTAVRVTTSETAAVYVFHVLVTQDRNTFRNARDFIGVSESGMDIQKRGLTASETPALYLRHVLSRQSRLIFKDARDHIGVTETASISITEPTPILNSCQISVADEAGDGARCRYNTGSFCESTIVQYRVNAGSWTNFQNMDTTPNSGPFISNFVTGLVTDDVIEFRIRPFSSDGQSGTEGSPCITNSYTIGEV